MALEGRLCDMVEPINGRVGKGDRTSTDLIIALVIDKKEEPVSLERSAESAAVLSAYKEGINSALASRRRGIQTEQVERLAVRLQLSGTLEAGERGHIVVAEEKEATSMKLIAACA